RRLPAAACRLSVPIPWSGQLLAHLRQACRAMRCCCRRHAQASTCSAITRSAAKCLRLRRESWRRHMASGALFYSDVKKQPPLSNYDHALVWSCILLLALGLVMVYSASIAIAEDSRATGYQPFYFLLRHTVFLVFGIVIGTALFEIPLRIWQRLALYLFLFGTMLLVLVLIPGIGREINGSQRWLSLYVVNLQPSEPMKLFAVLYAADYTVRKAAFMHSLKKGFMPLFIVMLMVGGL